MAEPARSVNDTPYEGDAALTALIHPHDGLGRARHALVGDNQTTVSVLPPWTRPHAGRTAATGRSDDAIY